MRPLQVSAVIWFPVSARTGHRELVNLLRDRKKGSGGRNAAVDLNDDGLVAWRDIGGDHNIYLIKPRGPG